MIQEIKRKLIALTGLSANEAHFYFGLIISILASILAYNMGQTIGWSAVIGFSVATLINTYIEFVDFLDKGFIEKSDIYYDITGQIAASTLFITLTSIYEVIK